MRIAVVGSQQLLQSDRAEARKADQVPDGASLIVAAGNAAATEAFGPADQAGRFT